MYLISNYRKKKTEYPIKRAIELQEKAASSDNEQLSRAFYCQAYEIYRKITNNRLLGDEIRGKAGYSMYLLAKGNKVKLNPIASSEIIYETSKARLEKLLIWSVNLGCEDAISELTDIKQPTFNSISLPSCPNTPNSRSNLKEVSCFA